MAGEIYLSGDGFVVIFLVCVSVMTKFAESLDETVKKDPKKIEDEFRTFCKAAKGKENRFVS